MIRKWYIQKYFQKYLKSKWYIRKDTFKNDTLKNDTFENDAFENDTLEMTFSTVILSKRNLIKGVSQLDLFRWYRHWKLFTHTISPLPRCISPSNFFRACKYQTPVLLIFVQLVTIQPSPHIALYMTSYSNFICFKRRTHLSSFRSIISRDRISYQDSLQLMFFDGAVPTQKHKHLWGLLSMCTISTDMRAMWGAVV